MFTIHSAVAIAGNDWACDSIALTLELDHNLAVESFPVRLTRFFHILSALFIDRMVCIQLSLAVSFSLFAPGAHQL